MELRALERQVGGALLVRTARGVEVTPAGAALLEQGQEILTRMDALSVVVRDIARRENQLLRVGLMSGTASAGALWISNRYYPAVAPGSTTILDSGEVREWPTAWSMLMG